MKSILIICGVIISIIILISHANKASREEPPSFNPSKWVQGEPITAFQPGKAYIVEFWASWCPPCIMTIPHLNAIHNKFKEKGLVVIGQNAGESEKTVTDFIAKMGKNMTYSVTLDEYSSVCKNWMTAHGQKGIPCAFLINFSGKLTWIGHPAKLSDEKIEELLHFQ